MAPFSSNYKGLKECVFPPVKSHSDDYGRVHEVRAGGILLAIGSHADKSAEAERDAHSAHGTQLFVPSGHRDQDGSFLSGR